MGSCIPTEAHAPSLNRVQLRNGSIGGTMCSVEKLKGHFWRVLVWCIAVSSKMSARQPLPDASLRVKTQ